MRRVLIGDVVAAARALLAVPRSQRPLLMRRILRAADLADRHRRERGRPHSRFGGGSLMAASAAWSQRPEPFADDPDYLHALACVVAGLRQRVSCTETPGSVPDPGDVSSAGPCLSSAQHR